MSLLPVLEAERIGSKDKDPISLKVVSLVLPII